MLILAYPSAGVKRWTREQRKHPTNRYWRNQRKDAKLFEPPDRFVRKNILTLRLPLQNRKNGVFWRRGREGLRIFWRHHPNGRVARRICVSSTPCPNPCLGLIYATGSVIRFSFAVMNSLYARTFAATSEIRSSWSSSGTVAHKISSFIPASAMARTVSSTS